NGFTGIFRDTQTKRWPPDRSRWLLLFLRVLGSVIGPLEKVAAVHCIKIEKYPIAFGTGHELLFLGEDRRRQQFLVQGSDPYNCFSSVNTKLAGIGQVHDLVRGLRSVQHPED